MLLLPVFAILHIFLPNLESSNIRGLISTPTDSLTPLPYWPDWLGNIRLFVKFYMPRLKDWEDKHKLLCRTISNKLIVLPVQNILVFLVCHWEFRTLFLAPVDALRLLLVCCLGGGLDQVFFFGGVGKNSKKGEKEERNCYASKKHLGKDRKLQLFCCCNMLFAFHLLQAVSFPRN